MSQKKNKKCYTEITISDPLGFKIENHRLRKKNKNRYVCLDCGLILKKFTVPREALHMFSIHEEEKVVV